MAMGVTLTAPDAALVPAAFVAVTLQLYAVPLVSDVTPIGLLPPVPVRVAPPPVHDTVYAVMLAPPFDDGAVNAILADAFPAVAVPMVGAPGTLTTPPVVLSSLHATIAITARLQANNDGSMRALRIETDSGSSRGTMLITEADGLTLRRSVLDDPDRRRVCPKHDVTLTIVAGDSFHHATTRLLHAPCGG
jgi:hypothetical protein